MGDIISCHPHDEEAYEQGYQDGYAAALGVVESFQSDLERIHSMDPTSIPPWTTRLKRKDEEAGEVFPPSPSDDETPPPPPPSFEKSNIQLERVETPFPAHIDMDDISVPTAIVSSSNDACSSVFTDETDNEDFEICDP